MKKETFIPAGIVLLVAVCGLLRLNDLSLYTDSTRYLLWAQSLGEFSGWVDNTQPVPEAYVVNAPLYPLLVAPGSWFTSSPMAGVKILTLIYGVLALVLFLLWVRRAADERTAIVLMALFGLMPMTVVLFTEVLSEGVYLLLVFWVLFLLQGRTRPEGPARTTLLCLLAILPLVREIGLALVAAVVIITFINGDRRFAVTLAGLTIGVFVLWSLRNLFLVGTPETSQAANVQFMLQRALTTQDESIFTEFARRVAANARSYRYELGGMILFPIPFPLIAAPSSSFLGVFHVLQAVKPFIFLLFVPMLLFGMWRDWSSDAAGRIRVLFVLLSLSIILLYPVQDVRFLYPLLPFFLFFGMKALQRLRDVSHAWHFRTAVVIAAALAVPNLMTTSEVVSTNQRYRAWSSEEAPMSEPPPGPYFSTPWERIGSWIQQHTADDAVIASSAKELAPFVGMRKVLEINKAVPRPQFEEMLRDFDVTALVCPVIQNGLYAYGFPLRESQKVAVREGISVGSVVILSIPSLMRDPQSADVQRPFDSVLVAQPDLRNARTLILDGQYAAADSVLRHVLATDPGNAEAAFQRVVAFSLSGERDAAILAQEALFGSPRSTSYIPISRRLLELAGHLEQARLLEDPSLSAGAWYQAARIGWDLGYTGAARQFLAMSLRAQPNAFEPSIWAAFYALTEGDLRIAEHILSGLRTTYGADPIVSDLSVVATLRRRVEHEQDTSLSSQHWLGIAGALERLELFSPALDAAITAARLDTSNMQAREQVRSLLTRTGKNFALERLRSY